MSLKIAHREVSYADPTATLTVYTLTGETFTYSADGGTKAEAIATVVREHVHMAPGESVKG